MHWSYQKEFVRNGNQVRLKGEDQTRTIRKGIEDLQFIEVLEGLSEQDIPSQITIRTRMRNPSGRSLPRTCFAKSARRWSQRLADLRDHDLHFSGGADHRFSSRIHRRDGQLDRQHSHIQ